MIALGRIFFRLRNALFTAVLIFAVFVCTPHYTLGDPRLDAWMDALGAVIALAGLAVRALTIGYEYIVRGGRNRQVYADQLVQRGVYAHTRNPMYLGNGLIIVGCALIVNAPHFYLVVLPFTALAYASIIAAEEFYLRDKFGVEFDAYCARVNRILPRLSGFGVSTEGMRFNWRRLLVKDYNTLFLGVVAIVGLAWWDDWRIQGTTMLPTVAQALAFVIPWALLYLVVWGLKKTRRLEAERPEREQTA